MPAQGHRTYTGLNKRKREKQIMKLRTVKPMDEVTRLLAETAQTLPVSAILKQGQFATFTIKNTIIAEPEPVKTPFDNEAKPSLQPVVMFDTDKGIITVKTKNFLKALQGFATITDNTQITNDGGEALYTAFSNEVEVTVYGETYKSFVYPVLVGIKEV